MEENWTWGLSLIALTIAIHAAGVATMALVLVDVHHRVASRHLGLRHVFAILIGLIGAVGLLLAILHGIEAGFWAAAYCRLGALGSLQDAILYSVEFDHHAGRIGTGAATALEPHGRAGGDRRHAPVRHQHGLCLRRNAGLLAHIDGSASAEVTAQATHGGRAPRSA